MEGGAAKESGRQGLRVLFLSRAFPPVIGGIENQNYALSEALAQMCSVRTIANRQGKWALPFFLPWVVIRAVSLLRSVDVILLGDGVMALAGWAIKRVYRSFPVACIVHGLDLTHPGRLYQRLWIRRFLPRLDHLIAVSRSTRDIAIKKGIQPEKVACIPNGINTNLEGSRHTRADLERMIGAKLGDSPVLVTVGRLIRRKGVAWFIRNVVPLLAPEIWYLVAGSGPERAAIEKAISELPPGHRVRPLGQVGEREKAILLDSADLFIQPNIPVEGDAEGFGIAVLEAGVRGLPVIAANLEGLRDAVRDGENGCLVEAEDARGFAETIAHRLADRRALQSFGDRTRHYVTTTFSWPMIAERYYQSLVRCVFGTQAVSAATAD